MKWQTASLFTANFSLQNSMLSFLLRIFIIFFVVVVGMGPTDFQQSWVFIISSEGRFTSEKSLSLFQHQTMSGSELPTSTFFPGSFFALLHSPISKLPVLLTWDVVKPSGNNLPFASFMRSGRNHCRGREVSELKLFFVCVVSLFQLS